MATPLNKAHDGAPAIKKYKKNRGIFMTSEKKLLPGVPSKLDLGAHVPKNDTQVSFNPDLPECVACMGGYGAPCANYSFCGPPRRS